MTWDDSPIFPPFCVRNSTVVENFTPNSSDHQGWRRSRASRGTDLERKPTSLYWEKKNDEPSRKVPTGRPPWRSCACKKNIAIFTPLNREPYWSRSRWETLARAVNFTQGTKFLRPGIGSLTSRNPLVHPNGFRTSNPWSAICCDRFWVNWQDDTSSTRSAMNPSRQRRCTLAKVHQVLPT